MLKIISTYTLTQYINKGEYGKVYKAINHSTSENVAIKMINLDKFIQNPKLVQLTQQQVQILTIVQSNQNIIKLKQIIKSNRYLYMVYEYCQGGTLEEYLKRNNRLNEKQAINIFRQLINAYQSLYENNIVHRDIKTDNIFFKNSVLKLADFGFSKRLKCQDDLMQTSLGSPLYMAPEVLNNDVYGSKADLWSCGIILYQMLFGAMPYTTTNIKQLINLYTQKSQLPFPIIQCRQYSPVLIQMLKRILIKDQFRRISWQEFLYQYRFTNEGGVVHKERDFEYDLMKLMKRNSGVASDEGNKGSCKEIKQKQNNMKSISRGIRFDWSKITDMNSSVHSQECSQEQKQQQQKYSSINKYTPQALYNSSKLINNQSPTPTHTPFSHLSQHCIPLNNSKSEKQISQIYNLKKTIKHFQQQHSKMVELLVILQQMLESKHDYQCDLRLVYFIVYNLCELLERNIRHVRQYMNDHSMLINKMNEEKSKLQRLFRIFSTELEANKFKINSIKTTLLTMDDIGMGMELFKYPKKESVLRSVMKEFVQGFVIECDGVGELGAGGDASEEKDGKLREQSVRLLKILWAVQLIMKDQQETKSNNNIQVYNINNKSTHLSMLSIKEQTPINQITSLINQYLIRLCI